jgi:biotin carboxyl carrier protein
MPQYNVLIGEREYDVEIAESELRVNGESVDFDLVSLNGNGLHLLQRDTQSVEVYLSPQQRGRYEVLIGGRRVMAQVDPAYRRRRPSQEPAAGAVTAAMPGMIVEVPVAVGDEVTEGDVVAVQEAMKMQMQLRAPCDGRVERVAVTSGADVEKGALLVKIVPTA